MQWMRAAVLVTAAAGLVATPRALLAQQPQTQPTPAATSAAPTRMIGTTVAQLRATLSDPTTPPPIRQESARRLVARQSQEARDALRAAITATGNAPGVAPARLAALTALAADPSPDQRIVPDLLRFVTTDTDRAVVEGAAEALAAYKGDTRVASGLAQAATDAKRPVPLRIPAIDALGTMVEQPAAAALVQIVSNAAEPVDVVNEAADALVEMTGLDANGRDPAKWEAWQKQNADRPAAEWKAELLDARSAREDRNRRRLSDAAREMKAIVAEAYQNTPPDARAARLLKYLNSANPEVKAAGAAIAGQLAATAPGENTPEIRERLLEMIGDADAGVRFDVITTLYNLNIEPEKILAALLPQFEVEPDPKVRSAIVRKLASIQRVEQVIDLLKRPEPEVIREAARGLRQRAPGIVKQDPALAKLASARLRETITRLAGQPRFLDARRACGEALAEFKDPANMEFSAKLMNPAEPAEIRGVAFQILGGLGAAAEDTIVGRVDAESDPRVRAAGMLALSRTESFNQSEWLAQKMTRTGEPDAEARKAARTAYETLLHSASIGKLNTEANIRKNDPTLRIAILKELVNRLKADGRPDALRDAAAVQQNLGEAYINAGQFAEAVPYLQDAVNYLRDKVGAGVMDRPLRQLTTAMLGAKQYEELGTLASDLFGKSSKEDVGAYQFLIGSKIRNEAQELVKRRQYQDAATLIDAALRVDPPFNSINLQDLQQIGKEVQESLRRTPAPAPTR